MLVLFILCATLLSVCRTTPSSCLELHQAQLSTLNDRLNQLISAVYSSPTLAKWQSLTKELSGSSNMTPASERPQPAHDEPRHHYPALPEPTPNIIYVSPSPYPTFPLPMPPKAPNSYYSPPMTHSEIPHEYGFLTSPWSQYYESHNSRSVPSLPSRYPPDPYNPPYAYPSPHSYGYPYRKSEYTPPIPPFHNVPIGSSPPLLQTPPAYISQGYPHHPLQYSRPVEYPFYY